MHRPRLLYLLLLTFAIATACAAAQQAPPLAALFHVSFDSNATPEAPGAKVIVTGADGLKYGAGKVGQGADFEQGQCVEYAPLPPLNLKSGTLELWIKPLHDRKELNDHYYLQLLSADGSPLMEVYFTHVEMSAEVTIHAAGRTFSRYGWSWPARVWNQLVITWDAASPSPAGLQLYINGVESGYPASYSPMARPARLRLGCKSPQDGVWSKAWLDDLTIYNRRLTPLQVKALYDRGRLPLAQKLPQMATLVAADEARAERQREQLFACKLGILHGRNTSLRDWPDSVYHELGLPVPTPIDENDLAKTDLSQFKVLICPGGGGLNLTEKTQQALQDYVKAGGGYVGICGGAVTAVKYGLIDAEMIKFNVRGSVWVKLKPHPITQGYDLKRMILFPHASGPLFVPKDKADQAIMTFDVGQPPMPVYAHTIVRQFGKGRVVIFSGHPEASSRTRPLLRHAIMWAAGILGEKQQAAAK